MTRTLSPAQLAHNRAIAVSGGKARARMADFMDHQRRNARITINKYGLARLIEIARERRKKHPSCHEQHFIDWLATVPGLRPYQREHPPTIGSLYSIDFAWPSEMKAIDIDGEVHDLFGGDTKAQMREAARVCVFLDNGWHYMRLHYTDLGSFEMMDKVKRFLLEANPTRTDEDDGLADIPF